MTTVAGARHLRVNMISYLSAEVDTGGGGAIRRGLVSEGSARGHRITSIHMYPSPRLDSPHADLWLLADVWNAPWHWRRRHRRLLSLVPNSPYRRYRKLIGQALESGRAVHLDNAYVDVCDLDYLPCNGLVEGDRCPFKRRLLPGGGRCYRIHTEHIYRASRLNVFVSPLHAGVVARLVGGLDQVPSMVLRPVLDPASFRSDPATERDIPLLFVGPFVEAKGSSSIRQSWPDGTVKVVGPPTPEALEYAGYTGPASPSEVAALMRRAVTFVFRPRWPEPFGRVVAEAVLSGCRLDANDQVGALSFGTDLSDARLYDGSAAEFWQRLEALVG